MMNISHRAALCFACFFLALHGRPALATNADDSLCNLRRSAKEYCYDYGKFNATRCSEEKVLAWLRDHERELLLKENEDMVTTWAFYTNITQETRLLHNEVARSVSHWRVMKSMEASRYPRKEYGPITQDYLRRATINAVTCADNDLKELVELNSKLTEAYSANEACFLDVPALNVCLVGTDKVSNALVANEDYDVLRAIWTRYHDGAAAMRPFFKQRLRLLNKGALENGYLDYGYFEWFTDMEDPQFLHNLQQHLREVMPLYKKLHAYVRHRLMQAYPGRLRPDGPIPIHLTGDLWGQSWGNILNRVKPYSSVPSIDITAKLRQMNITAKKMFEISEEFFVSLGLFSMTPTFWAKSMIEQPDDGRIVECHASAWDFYVGDDYRIKMCTDVTHEHFVVIHHEMGHVQYFMAYRNQSLFYRQPITGFHEAIGDAISLSVMTPEHLKLINLLDELPTSAEFDINFLFTIALDTVAFLPFAYAVEVWRWATFNGSIDERNYNSEWWRLRLQYSGLAPPLEEDRYNEQYFDPGAKYHVATNVPYIRYFVSYLLEFQFYEAMCTEAGHQGPLHRCDFYNSTKAGSKLKHLLSIGSSLPWQDALEQMTGSRNLKSDSIIAYFKPLESWLDKFLAENDIFVGWTSNAPRTSYVHACLALLPAFVIYWTSTRGV